MSWRNVLNVVGGVLPNLIAGNGPGIMGGPLGQGIWDLFTKPKPMVNTMQDGAPAVGTAATDTSASSGQHAGGDHSKPRTAPAKGKEEAQLPPGQIPVQMQGGPVPQMPIETGWLNLHPYSMDRNVGFQFPYSRKYNGKG